MRPILKEPLSLSALWSIRLVLCGIGVALVAAIATRVDWLDGMQGMIGIALGLLIVVAGFCLALIAGVSIWYSGRDGARYAVYAGVLALMALAGPAFIMARAAKLPPINDISTDLTDVPEFIAAAAARPKGANSIAYGGAAVARQQKHAYPSVKPLLIDVATDDVDELIEDAIKEQKWFILSKTPFRGATGEGHIEAVARTLILGFRDDIVIRTREVDGRVRVDMRSASRYGKGDLGANAKRITEFLDELRNAARQLSQ